MFRSSKLLVFGFSLWAAIAFAQAPSPVPALPDSARLTTYSISTSTCACSVGFQIYGSGTDVDEWIQVYVNGVAKLSTDPTFGWSLSSVSPGGLTGPRPITNAILTFNTAQTATVVIVGNERPRRLSQFSENRGVAARDLNQVVTDQIAVARETWDKLNRAIVGQPGEIFNPLPPAASRSGLQLCFDSNGLPIVCATVSTGSATFPGVTTNGDLSCWSGTLGKALSDCGSPSNLLATQGVPINPVWYGADPTGAADSTTAINSAIAAATTTYVGEKQIYLKFPPGFFKINSQISIALGASIGSVRVEGAGPLLTTLWFPNASTGLSINLGTNPSAGAHVRDLTFATSGIGTSPGLTVTSSTANYTFPITDLTNLDFVGLSGYGQGEFFSTAITINGVSNVVMQNLNVYGGGATCVLSLSNACGTGLLIEQNGGNVTNFINVANSNFYYLSAGINGVGDIEGLTVQQSSFLANSVGILSTVGTGLTLQWSIGPNNNFTDVFTDIKVVNPINGLLVNNNLFLLLNAGQVGVSVGATINNGLANIYGNYIGCTAGTTKGIYIGSSTANIPSNVFGNVIDSCATGIQTDTGSALINVTGNSLGSNTTAINNTGTLNVITNNTGYNPVGYTAGTSTGTSASVISAGASPETHYITQSANFNAVVAKCTLLACGTSTNLCTVPSATVPCVLNLGPNESYKVTWTTTQPTYTKDIH